MYSKGWTLFTLTEEVIGWRKEQFKELLNLTNPSSTIEAAGINTGVPGEGHLGS